MTACQTSTKGPVPGRRRFTLPALQLQHYCEMGKKRLCPACDAEKNHCAQGHSPLGRRDDRALSGLETHAPRRGTLRPGPQQHRRPESRLGLKDISLSALLLLSIPHRPFISTPPVHSHAQSVRLTFPPSPPQPASQQPASLAARHPQHLPPSSVSVGFSQFAVAVASALAFACRTPELLPYRAAALSPPSPSSAPHAPNRPQRRPMARAGAHGPAPPRGSSDCFRSLSRSVLLSLSLHCPPHPLTLD